MSLFAAALAWGDEHDPFAPELKRKGSARAFREGARGTLYLDGVRVGAMPTTPAEQKVVYASRSISGQARRWAGARMARAEGRAGRGNSDLISAESAANLGTAHRADFADRLIGDLREYLANVGPHVPGRREPHGSAKKVTSPASAVVQGIITALDVITPSYPPHMSPSTLARPLTVSAYRGSATPADPALSSGKSAGLTLRAMLDHARRVILVGPPGSGKSTALTGLVVDELRKGRSAISVRLPDIARELTAASPPTDAITALRAVTEVAFRELAIPLPSETPAGVPYLVTDSNLVVALDGLDEVKPAQRRRVLALIRHLASIAGYLVIATRPHEAPVLSGDWTTAHVDTLPPNYSDGFLDAWFGVDAPIALARAKRALRDARAADLARNPVTLGLVATVAAQEDVPTTRAQLYDRYVSILLARKWRPAEEKRPSVADIAARRAIVEDVAWMAATGWSAWPGLDVWTDTVTLADVERYLPSTDLLVAEDLLRNDVLLKPEGADPSPRHQRYVWGHRTVQEHLVGSRLARLRRQATIVSQEGLERAAFGSFRWREPLRHMIQLLDGRERRDLFDHLERLRLGGDPGDTIRFLKFDMARQIPEGTAIRNQVARALAEDGLWGHVRDLDEPLSEEAYSRALVDGRARDVLFLNGLPQDRRLELLPDLVAQYRDSGQGDEGVYMDLLTELLSVDSDDALRRYLELLEGGSDARLFPALRHDPVPPSDSVVREVMARGSKLPGPARMALLQSLALVGIQVTDYSTPHGPVKALDVQALDLIPRLSNAKFREPKDDDAYLAIARGEYGNDLAYTLGRSAVDVPHLGRDAPYAQLGLAVAQLFRGDQISGGVSLDHPVAVSVLTQADRTGLSDPGRAIQLVRATARIAANPRETALGDAFRAYRSTLRLRDSLHLDFETTEHDTAQTVIDCVRDVLFRHPFGKVLDTLLASDPADWPRVPEHAAGVLDLAGILNMIPYDDRVKEASEEELAEVTVWAARASLSALGCLEGDMSLDVDVERIAIDVYRRAPHALTLPGNAAWITPALRELGLLYDWRERLC